MMKESTVDDWNKAIRLQVMAKFFPERLNIPEGFRPRTAFDKHVFELTKGRDHE